MKKLIFFTIALSSLSSFAAYEDHFPAYYEYCSASQWKTLAGKKGGIAGHGFTYIHGLCKDYGQRYPQVIPCEDVAPALKATYPHEGVGVSLDSYYSNAMWAAVPGRDLTFFGETPRRPIRQAEIDAHIKKMVELRVHEGVVLNPTEFQSLSPDSPEYLEKAAMATLGTDHAINWARELHCVRIPVPKEKLKDVATYLNEQNLQYKNGPKKYKWSALYNNCTHFSMNIGHALGINKSIKTDQFILKQLANLAIPGNLFMMYADMAVLKKAKAAATYSPLQVGSLLSHYEAYQDGEYFDTKKLKEFVAPRVLKPFKLFMTPRKYEKYFTPANTDLKENAAKWRVSYMKLLQKQDDSAVVENLEKQLKISEEILKTE